MSRSDGRLQVSALPIGDYTVRNDAAGFGAFEEDPIHLSVGETVRVVAKLSPASVEEHITVASHADELDLVTNTLGRTATKRERVDKPLNSRNFAQLGLLQTGVAPLTTGLLTEDGSLRASQSYVVNGKRPEGNNFLLDGAQNADRMDGVFALRVPIDALQESRILTATTPPEYGGNTGSVTSIVARSGTTHVHGTVYEFLRNDLVDAQNYIATRVEPLKQNQYGATVGGPLTDKRLFYFTYYEGLRNRAGVTTSATVPTAAQQNGDFSGSATPLLNMAAGGTPSPDASCQRWRSIPSIKTLQSCT